MVVVVVINAVIAIVSAVVAHGPGFAEGSCLLAHNSTSLGTSTRHTNQKLSAYSLGMGLMAGRIRFVANSQYASNFETIS